ncbi:MAG: 2-succinyl-6-hydroxy-2,4-cyclohexadiene-1-carboxylate synthase [Synechococcales cyanobacterium CRU_2_2]|nr:2-succinyl-6-hydroxy-2,4-cyclohexadiene-1-carboxylate synthase [Synechococcales cyanobacterium CRU_2_2]
MAEERIDFYAIRRGVVQGPVLLFLHGFMGSCRDWLPVMERLSDRFSCVAVDLPGHGQTCCTNPKLYRMETTARLLVDWLQKNKILSRGIVGYSMGGRLALYCALSYPQVFPQAILESASPGLRKSKDRKARRELDLDRSRAIEIDFLNFLFHWHQQPLFTSLWKQSGRCEALVECRLRNNPEGLARSLREMGTGSQPSLWLGLKSHSYPLLLLTGESDSKFTTINQEMASCCPGARHEILAGVGHNAHVEDPGAIADRIQAFMG